MSQLNLKKYKWLFLPIESQVRELNGKILLSLVAAERGWGVIFGHKSMFSPKYDQLGGVVIEINVSRGYKNNICSHVKSGRRICAWCEEGLVYLNSATYFQRKLDQAVLNMLDKFFLWGDTQGKDINAHIKGVKDKTKLTGNPRIDLHRPELHDYFLPKITEINKKYGQIILINTNFDRFNHYFGKDWVIPSLREKREITTERQAETQARLIKHQERLFNHFVQMVSQVSSNFPNHSIIIRPHPSENHEVWKKITNKLKNVHVVHEDDVIPWILASDALIHNSCMTAVQGYLLGKPVISYMPIKSTSFDYPLPNSLSLIARSNEDLLATLEKVITNSNYDDEDKEEKQAISEKYISSFTGALASDRIMDELDELEIEPKPFIVEKTNSNVNNIISSLIKKPLRVFSSIRKKLLSKDLKTMQTYTSQKFPGLSLDEIKAAVSKFQEVTQRFSKVEVRQLEKNVFCILPPQ